MLHEEQCMIAWIFAKINISSVRVWVSLVESVFLPNTRNWNI